jgi:hypothetical protein
LTLPREWILTILSASGVHKRKDPAFDRVFTVRTLELKTMPSGKPDGRDDSGRRDDDGAALQLR